MKHNRIQIASVFKRELANKYRTSITTVQMSLDYYNNSDQAREIRKDAKKLLIAEAQKIQD